MKTKKNQLGKGMQALEDRRLMAVDVTMSGGDLVITGDGAADHAADRAECQASHDHCGQ